MIKIYIWKVIKALEKMDSSSRISNIAVLREDVLKGDILGMVSLRGLFEGGKEADIDYILGITYPSAEIKNLLETVVDKLKDKNKVGFFELIGGYGTGKSHILLMLYHLFNNPTKGKEWLESKGVKISLPTQARVIPIHLMDSPPDYLWEPIFEKLGEEDNLKKITSFPGASLLKGIVRNKGNVVIIIDELESWYRSVKDKDSNLNFIQVLAEVASEIPNLVVFCALYGEERNITARTDRVKSYRVNLTQSKDRPKIILFRLIKSVDKDRVSQIASGYVSQYSKSELDVENLPHYEQLIEDCYPVHPELIKTLLEQYSSSENYQNTRGVLFILSSILREKSNEVDLLLTSDIDMEEPDLLSLDRQIVENARKDSEIIGESLARNLLNCILLYSFGEEKITGIPRDKIVLGTLRPGMNINDIDVVLANLPKVAPHVWVRDGKYVIGRKANIMTIIQNKAVEQVRKGEIKKAVEVIKQKLRRDMSHIIYHPDEEFSDEIPDNDEIKIVVSLKTLNQSEIESFYHGKEYANKIILYVPKEGDLTSNEDVLVIGKRLQLCGEYKVGASEDNLKLMNELEIGDNRYLSDKLFSEIYGYWVKITEFKERKVNYRLMPCELREVRSKVKLSYEAETIKDEILRSLDRKETGAKLDDILYAFKTNPSKPIILDGSIFEEAVRNLLREGQIVMSHKGRVYTKDEGLPLIQYSAMEVILKKYFKPIETVTEYEPRHEEDKSTTFTPLPKELETGEIIVKPIPSEEIVTTAQYNSIFRLSEELERKIPTDKKIGSVKIVLGGLNFKDFQSFSEYTKQICTTTAGKSAKPSDFNLTLEFKDTTDKGLLIKLIDSLPVLPSGSESKVQAVIGVISE